VRVLKGMVFDAVSLHKERVLSMESFLDAIGRREIRTPGAPVLERNPFCEVEKLPTFGEALQLLVEEAMTRAGGNQTLASRLLGISQPALSKRLKAYRLGSGSATDE